MNKEYYELFKEICPDFGEYNFLKSDLYKGKIIGGYNLYYKKGDNGKEGMITGKKNIVKFNLDQFPVNFKSYGKFDQSEIEYGWSDEELLKVLNQIKLVVNSDN